MHITQNPIIYLTKKTWEYSEGNRKSVTLYFTLFLVANLVSLAEPLVVAKLLNIVQEQGVSAATLPVLFNLLLLFLLLTLAFWAFHGPARVIENRNAFLVRANYKKHLLEGTMGLPLEWHTDHHSGDTIDKIEKGTSALYHYSADTFTVIESVVRLAGSYLALTYFHLHSAYIVFFMVVVTLTLITSFDRRLIKQYRELYGAENKISEKIFDVVSNVTTVIILRVEKLVASAIVKKMMEPLRLYVSNNKLNEVKWFLVSVASTLTTVLVLGSYLAANVRHGTPILVGTLYALYGYVQNISGLFFRFAYMYGDMVRQKAAVMNAEEVAKDFREAGKATRGALGTKWRELVIRSLAFSYNQAKEGELHLDNVSLTLRRGEKVALIGESGSGKTTLLKIIRELYRPDRAELSLDGVPLPEGFRAISEDIALIPQDPEIFTTTILENITLGVPHDLEYVRRFTDMACFTEVAERLPKQFDSSIVEKGVNLSGGEKQRLALARGLLACVDKSIVLLDEPTSSVDSRNELRIYEHIFKAFRGKTVIATVHRLHLLPMFDTIYLFREGKIAASGTFEQLLVRSRDFKKQWERYNKLKGSGRD